MSRLVVVDNALKDGEEKKKEVTREREREWKGLWLCLSALVPGVGLSAVPPPLEPFGPNLLLPCGSVFIEHSAATQLSPLFLHCWLCSQTGTGQVASDPCGVLRPCFGTRTCAKGKVGAAEGPRVPASSWQAGGLKRGPACLWEVF